MVVWYLFLPFVTIGQVGPIKILPRTLFRRKWKWLHWTEFLVISFPRHGTQYRLANIQFCTIHPSDSYPMYSVERDVHMYLYAPNYVSLTNYDYTLQGAVWFWLLLVGFNGNFAFFVQCIDGWKREYNSKYAL